MCIRDRSYKNTEIEKILNRHFIPVKVDRELQPALDQTLMAFVQSTQGRGGWPLNVFLTSEGYPLYAVLYVPPESFSDVIGKINALWGEDPERIAAVARQHGPKGFADKSSDLDEAEVSALGKAFEKMALGLADTFEGGFGNQSRFPHVPQLDYLLHRYGHAPNAQIREVLETTLDAMAQRGLHDHLGSGFFRYTVDPGWSVPHFEKMLYDNGQLATVYAEAYRLTGRDDFRRVLVEMLDFVLREMTSPEGGFYSALDADSEGEEGTFYTWSLDELRDLLGSDYNDSFFEKIGVTQRGNFEGRNIIHLPNGVSTYQEIWENTESKPSPKSIMLKKRNSRVRPFKDCLLYTSDAADE